MVTINCPCRTFFSFLSFVESSCLFYCQVDFVLSGSLPEEMDQDDGSLIPHILFLPRMSVQLTRGRKRDTFLKDVFSRDFLPLSFRRVWHSSSISVLPTCFMRTKFALPPFSLSQPLLRPVTSPFTKVFNLPVSQDFFSSQVRHFFLFFFFQGSTATPTCSHPPPLSFSLLPCHRSLLDTIFALTTSAILGFQFPIDPNNNTLSFSFFPDLVDSMGVSSFLNNRKLLAARPVHSISSMITACVWTWICPRQQTWPPLSSFFSHHLLSAFSSLVPPGRIFAAGHSLFLLTFF